MRLGTPADALIGPKYFVITFSFFAFTTEPAAVGVAAASIARTVGGTADRPAEAVTRETTITTAVAAVTKFYNFVYLFTIAANLKHPSIRSFSFFYVLKLKTNCN
jgi:nitrate/nitrite transporter NarK